MPGDRRDAHDGRGNLRHQLLGLRRWGAGEFGQMDHRHQFAYPRQSAHQVFVGAVPNLAEPGDVRTACLLALAAAVARLPSRDGRYRLVVGRLRSGEQAVHFTNPYRLSSPRGTQLAQAAGLTSQDILDPAVQARQGRLQLGLDPRDGLRHRVDIVRRCCDGLARSRAARPARMIGRYNGQNTSAWTPRETPAKGGSGGLSDR